MSYFKDAYHMFIFFVFSSNKNSNKSVNLNYTLFKFKAEHNVYDKYSLERECIYENRKSFRFCTYFTKSIVQFDVLLVKVYCCLLLWSWSFLVI